VPVYPCNQETKKAAWEADPSKPIKLLQWNIERGYKLKEVIEELRALDADVLSLQEVIILKAAFFQQGCSTVVIVEVREADAGRGCAVAPGGDHTQGQLC